MMMIIFLNWSLEDVLYYMVKEKIWVVLRRCVNWNVFGCANFINVKPFPFWLIAFTQWPDQQWPSQFQWDCTTILYFAACYWCTNWKQTTCAQGRFLCCNVWGNLFCCTCWWCGGIHAYCTYLWQSDEEELSLAQSLLENKESCIILLTECWYITGYSVGFCLVSLKMCFYTYPWVLWANVKRAQNSISARVQLRPFYLELSMLILPLIPRGWVYSFSIAGQLEKQLAFNLLTWISFIRLLLWMGCWYHQKRPHHYVLKWGK